MSVAENHIRNSHPTFGLPLVGHPLISDWISFAVPGQVTAYTGKVEIGQGISTALAMIVAEELDVDLSRIAIVAGDTLQTPDEGLTSSSFSVEHSGGALRMAASAARALLIGEAAKRFGVAVHNGSFALKSGQTGESYWTLADFVDLDGKVVDLAMPKPARDYALVGASGIRPDIGAKLSGAAFIHDMDLPGMLHARIVRAPHELAVAELPKPQELHSILPQGVQHYRAGNFVAVLAAREDVAIKACDSLAARTNWRVPGFRSDDPFEEIDSSPAEFEVAHTTAPTVPQGPYDLEVSLTRRFVAAASIGTSCGLALMEGGKLTVWTHSQAVFLLIDALSRLLKIEKANIRAIHVPAAGCYGHNGADDAAADAALLAQAYPGTPIRVVWTRAQELSTPLGTAMRTTVRSRFTTSNSLEQMEIDAAGGSFARRPGLMGATNLLAGYLRDGAVNDPILDPPLAFGGGIERNGIPLYRIPNVRLRKKVVADLSVRTSSLRSLGAHLNVAAIEAMMDEAALRAEVDPVEYRIQHLDDPRAIELLRHVSRMAGWSEGATDGRAFGLGFAQYKNKAGYCAVIAELSVDNDVTVHRIWSAVDVGLAVDPDGVIAQVEGGIIQALSWTLREEVRFESGTVTSLGWEAYPILRFPEIPDVTVEVLQHREEPPVGAGEIAQGPAAAAIVNGVARALGMRVNDLPLTRDRIMATALNDA
jgi:CO/xanthine dehydrogenase Mo-binding subunit